MNDFTDVLETIAQNARRGHERAGDYRGEDGLLYCGRCRTRKEHRLELDTDPPKAVTVPVMCKCEEERQEAQRKEEERIKFRQDCERLRRDGKQTRPIWSTPSPRTTTGTPPFRTCAGNTSTTGRK